MSLSPVLILCGEEPWPELAIRVPEEEGRSLRVAYFYYSILFALRASFEVGACEFLDITIVSSRSCFFMFLSKFL